MAFVEAASVLADRLGPFADVETGWELLATAERIAPAEVERVLMYPTVGVWLSRALRHVVGLAPDGTPFRSEVGGFHTVVAAVAVRGGLPCELSVPVMYGAVTLPSVGLIRLATDFPLGHVRLRNTVDGVSLSVPGEPLEPVRRHRSAARGRSITVAFDDLDVYRAFGPPTRAEPLASADHDEWCKLLDEAWDMLTASQAASAEELAAALVTITPLDAGPDVFAASSSAAFGGIAMSPKRSAVEFGEALVHELQHSKVNGLLDLVDLCHGEAVARHYAPWRDDPRPVQGLLHGAYAFVSVVEFWRAQRDRVPPELAARARFGFALRARQVGEVVDTLRRSTELTGLGREFVAGVSVRLAACDPADVPPDLAAAVALCTADHRAVWRLRHVRPAGRVVAGLAEAWLSGGTADVTGPSEVVAAATVGATRLGALVRLSVLDPDRLRRLADGPDLALLRGDRDAAARGYAARLRRAPQDVQAWSGFGLASGSTSLTRTPETVRAVHHEIAVRTGAAPDPAELAAWFDRLAR
ncbi:HEXXH motif-containing protein [Saccharothrix tamanrassetensis]|uniref:HEXXH motif-containing protein n=1 Tax=Saccharothrix tamanrassetensis TaxID=1051531 RepID=A0A841CII6_9PSEU|nr:HEXXH motif domain-containing protein [Saccharothrix tamanrassetensis]MBB5956793.1 HEXXH motif-containing protein [Saccharothrix tamanrassetensis]